MTYRYMLYAVIMLVASLVTFGAITYYHRTMATSDEYVVNIKVDPTTGRVKITARNDKNEEIIITNNHANNQENNEPKNPKK